MIKVSDNTIKEILSDAQLNGSGSHYISTCPFCDKKDHLYVQRETSRKDKRGNNASWQWQCKKCGEEGRLYKLLKQFDRLDVLEFSKSIDYVNPLKSIQLIEQLESIIDLQVDPQALPTQFQRVAFHDYLHSRGFAPWQYRYYRVGVVPRHPALKDYVVFSIVEDGVNKAYVSRNTHSRQWLDAFNRKAKEAGTYKKLRWSNSTADFSKLLFGIDEVSSHTKTVILVEGVFDKTNVDKLLNLNKRKNIKCLCTFGKKVSLVQVAKLKKKGVSHVILMFDPDAIGDSKKESYQLSRHFHVTVVYLKDNDPGDLSYDELIHALKNRENPLQFYFNKISSKPLK